MNYWVFYCDSQLKKKKKRQTLKFQLNLNEKDVQRHVRRIFEIP